jgi:O-methyltransferase involved in polyketide biosynthesis
MSEPSQAGVATSGDYDEISYTAIKVLQKRARYTTIPFSQEMADAAGVPRVSAARAWAQRCVWGRVRAGFYLQVRHDAISAALAAHPESAVLEIGAGYTTRGLAEAAAREAYIESDLPSLIARKRALVEAALGRAPGRNHHFVPFNACSRADAEAVRGLVLGLRLRRPLAVVNEGILMYLDDGEQQAFRDNVRLLLSACAPAGAWITTDLSERDGGETVVQRWLNHRLTRRLGRPFSRFPSDDAVHAFLAEGGLRGRKLASVAGPDADADVRAVAERFRAWRITLDGGAAASRT